MSQIKIVLADDHRIVERVGAAGFLQVSFNGRLGKRRAQIPSSRHRFVDGTDEIQRRGIFENVGRGTIAERFEHVGLIGVHGEDHDPSRAGALGELPGDFQTIQARHHQIHD